MRGEDCEFEPHYLTETIGLWGEDLEVVFASHRCPTWGRNRGVEFLSMQRDMYLLPP